MVLIARDSTKILNHIIKQEIVNRSKYPSHCYICFMAMTHVLMSESYKSSATLVSDCFITPRKFEALLVLIWYQINFSQLLRCICDD